MQASKPKPFSPLLFSITILLSVAPLIALAWFVAPQSFGASLWTYFLTFLCMHFATCMFEHPFHRYILHARVIPGLGNLYKAHTQHHALTQVRIRPKTEDPKIGEVRNRYPIVSEEQYESSFFPWWSLLGFSLFASIFLFPLQWLIPEVPILLVGYGTIAWAMCLYEIWHAIEHLPFETWWKPKINHPKWGNFWKKIYMFHLRHHLDIKCNECISGFFLLPIADWLLGTFKMPNTLYEDGSVAKVEEAESPRPGWLIRQVDRLVDWKMGKRTKAV